MKTRDILFLQASFTPLISFTRPCVQYMLVLTFSTVRLLLYIRLASHMSPFPSLPLWFLALLSSLFVWLHLSPDRELFSSRTSLFFCYYCCCSSSLTWCRLCHYVSLSLSLFFFVSVRASPKGETRIYVELDRYTYVCHGCLFSE